jgi:hypothetical protein
VIQRTGSESRRVNTILKESKTEHLQCRAGRFHQYIMPPETDIDYSPGLRSMTLIYRCPECRTTRFDIFQVRVKSDFTIKIMEMTSRRYQYEEGYSHNGDDPQIKGLEYMQEYLNRILPAMFSK